MFLSRRTSPTMETDHPSSKRPFFPARQRPRPRRSSPRRRLVSSPVSGVVNLLLEKCPTDVVPKILAFCGPQTVAVLSQTNRQWRDVCLAESTWRILCEDLYKWSEGNQIPSSWRQYYQDNPCVPIDYPTLPAALATAQVVDDGTLVMEQRRTIRVLLRPGDYILREAIVIQASENVHVTIETMKGPFTANHQVAKEERTEASFSPTRKFARKASDLKHRLRLGCRSAAQHVETVDSDLDHPPLKRLSSSRPPCDVASLILRTRRHNEPIVRVRQGAVKLINLELLHNSHGVDIWNGNAAIQIQPPVPGEALPTIPPTAWMESVEVVSHSGRGIVNIDGGVTVIKNCYVHDCAATGIYVGGPGSQAHIERTDVLHNGNGSRNRRGIGRGHSGVYLEQGTAFIRDCNISRNSLTGISAISSTNSVLDMEASDLVANGAAQLEVPRGLAVAHSVDFTRNNRLAAIGFTRQRSGLVHEPLIQEAMGL